MTRLVADAARDRQSWRRAASPASSGGITGGRRRWRSG